MCKMCVSETNQTLVVLQNAGGGISINQEDETWGKVFMPSRQHF